MDTLMKIDWSEVYANCRDYAISSMETMQSNYDQLSYGERIYMCFIHIVWPISCALLAFGLTRKWMVRSFTSESKKATARYLQLESRLQERLRLLRKGSEVLNIINRQHAVIKEDEMKATLAAESTESSVVICNNVRGEVIKDEQVALENKPKVDNQSIDKVEIQTESNSRIPMESKPTKLQNSPKDEIKQALTKRTSSNPVSPRIVRKTSATENANDQVIVGNKNAAKIAPNFQHVNISKLTITKPTIKNSPTTDVNNSTLKIKPANKAGSSPIGDGLRKRKDFTKHNEVAKTLAKSGGGDVTMKPPADSARRERKPTISNRPYVINKRITPDACGKSINKRIER